MTTRNLLEETMTREDRETLDRRVQIIRTITTNPEWAAGVVAGAVLALDALREGMPTLAETTLANLIYHPPTRLAPMASTPRMLREALAEDDTLTPAEFGRLVEEDLDARERASWEAEDDPRLTLAPDCPRCEDSGVCMTVEPMGDGPITHYDPCDCPAGEAYARRRAARADVTGVDSRLAPEED